MYAFIVIVPLDTVALVAVAVQGRGGYAQRGEETSRYKGLSGHQRAAEHDSLVSSFWRLCALVTCQKRGGR